MTKNETIQRQVSFLKAIEALLPSNTSLVGELSDQLDISMDSAYRRMRGETFLGIDEVLHLTEKYNIPFLGFDPKSEGVVSFKYVSIKPTTDSFREYFLGILQDLRQIKNSGIGHIKYFSQDIPVFYHYKYKYLSAFKIFYWMKSILNVTEFEDSQFDINAIPEDIMEIAEHIAEHYKCINSTEVWTDTTIVSTIQQIKYYVDAGLFKSDKDALNICKDLKQELEDIQNMAKESSYRNSEGQLIEFKLLYSDVEFTNNCVLVEVGDLKATYLGHRSFSTMSTNSKTYSQETETWMNNLISKSTAISGLAEKTRFQFFKKQLKQIDKLEQHIED